ICTKVKSFSIYVTSLLSSMRTRSRANFRRENRKAGRNGVVEEPLDRAGDALGHAGETSEVFSAWPRRLLLNCGDHRSERARCSSPAGVICSGHPCIGGRAPEAAA